MLLETFILLQHLFYFILHVRTALIEIIYYAYIDYAYYIIYIKAVRTCKLK